MFALVVSMLLVVPAREALSLGLNQQSNLLEMIQRDLLLLRR